MAGEKVSVYDEAARQFDIATIANDRSLLVEDETGEHVAISYVGDGDVIRCDLTKIPELGDIRLEHQRQVPEIEPNGDSHNVVISDQYYVRAHSGLFRPQVRQVYYGDVQGWVSSRTQQHLRRVLRYGILVAPQPQGLLQSLR